MQRTVQRAVRLLLAVSVAAVFVPSAQAHLVLAPLPNEIHVLHDPENLQAYGSDGYDVQDLFVREAYWPPSDAEGIIVRFDLHGGGLPVPLSLERHIDLSLTAGGEPRTFRLSSADHRNWSGDMVVIQVDVSPYPEPLTGATVLIQAFIPYQSLGAGAGDTLTAFALTSSAGSDPVDRAPGGYYAPAGGPEVEESESVRLVDELKLTGPDGYTTTAWHVHDGVLTITATNAFEDQGQHLMATPRPTAGWAIEADGPTQASVDGGKTATFRFQVTRVGTPNGPVAVAIDTDTGGREWVLVDAASFPAPRSGTTTPPPAAAPPPTDVTPPETDDAPTPGLVVTCVAFAALALAARRARR